MNENNPQLSISLVGAARSEEDKAKEIHNFLWEKKKKENKTSEARAHILALACVLIVFLHVYYTLNMLYLHSCKF